MCSANNSFEPSPGGPFKRLGKVLRVCVRQLDAASVNLDDALQTMEDLVKERLGLESLLPPDHAKRRPRDPKDQPVVAYARSVALKWTSVDCLEAVVDGRRVVLSRMLGLLLELLVARGGSVSSPTRFGWKTRSELRFQMGDKTGRKVSQHAFETQLSRLKGKLRDQAGLGTLIQRNGRFLVRFVREEDVAEEEGGSALRL
jgi:hypothetical protein